MPRGVSEEDAFLAGDDDGGIDLSTSRDSQVVVFSLQPRSKPFRASPAGAFAAQKDVLTRQVILFDLGA